MLENPYQIKRSFFDKGNTKSYEFRLEQLKRLKEGIKENETNIIDALTMDLGKPEFESYTAEIGIIYQEINLAIRKLKTWMKRRIVATPIILLPAISYIYSEPKGVVLIVSPWNYPFQLIMSPLIGAIAAGNCAVLKPSNKSIRTQYIISKIIEETFDPNYISVVEGPGSSTVNPLIENYIFDHIFFTGSVNVGKVILESASKHLTTVTLELGGKSPAIIHSDCDIDIAAKRIAWSKFYNTGQTCIAPDYVLIHESTKEQFVTKLQSYIKEYFGDHAEESNNYGRIISTDRFDKLMTLLDEGSIISGGNSHRKIKYIEPTLIDGVDMNSKIMKEEIFGPILPILTYEDISEVVKIVRINRYPLALYLFTKDKAIEDYIIDNIEFGGGCINHAISHVINPNLPFGGVGFSGMGHYHSKYTFDTFSHEKSIFKALTKYEMNLKFPPYTEMKLKLAKRFLK